MTNDHFQRALVEQRKSNFEALIELEKSSYRSVTLINGAAAVALLAFIGNTWSKGSQGLALAATSIRFAMICFVFGVIAGCGGTILSYLGSHFGLHGAADHNIDKSNRLNRLARISLLVGILFFAVGSIVAVFAFT